MEFTRMDGIARWHSPHPYFWFNSVLCWRDATADDNGTIEETIAYFQSRKIKSIGWWLEDGVSRASWEDLLTKYGFEYFDGPPGMDVDLKKLPEKLSIPSGLEIRMMNGPEELHDYAHLITTAFQFPSETEPAAYDWARGLKLGMPLLIYMAYQEGKLVGTSTIFYGAGVAGIYTVGVSSEARRKGVGTAMTLHPLLEARDKGYRVGILQSSEMGYKVYQRLGFEKRTQLGCFHLKLP
jgi:GNAT superfamily N-acetyltransferase